MAPRKCGSTSASGTSSTILRTHATTRASTLCPSPMKMDWTAIWMPNSVMPAKKTGATSPTSPTSRASLVKTPATAAGNRMTSSAQVPSKANDAPISRLQARFTRSNSCAP